MKDFLKETADKIGLAISEYEERITLYGLKGIHFEGHKGIMEYTEESVSVKVGKRVITISGRRLLIKAVTKDELFISGIICGLEVKDAI